MHVLLPFAQPEAWVALLTLTALEVVLGIDNIVFLSIVVSKLPLSAQGQARRWGLGLALFMRLGLLATVSWLVGLTAPWFSILGKAFSGRDLILGIGGLFLLAKATHEIFGELELKEEERYPNARQSRSFAGAIVQIVLLDIVFSLDSVITAVGMTRDLLIMSIAVVIAVLIMLVFAKAIGDFILRHPSMKVLALSFLLMIGVMLVAESFDQHIDKRYIYFAMAFSLLVEVINLRVRRATELRKQKLPVDERGDAARDQRTASM